MLLTIGTSYLTLLAGLLAAVPSLGSGKPNQKPNVVLILTDDQSLDTFSKREYLPKINKHLIDKGVYYDNFFAPVSVCCPSRVSLLRAQYAHNHNVTFVSPPWGGWARFNDLGYVGHTLPDFVQQAGYNTYYTGKLMNDHTEENCETLPVSGYNSSDFLVDPYTYDYWNPGFSRDNGPVKVHPGVYSTDLIRDKALDYLEDALAEDRPFFLTVAPIASHSWFRSDARRPDAETGFTMEVPPGAPRHATLFPTEQLPRTGAWNPDRPHGVSWVKTLPKLNTTQEAYLDDFFRGRLRSLQAVDEMTEQLVEKLEAAGQLDNTYIIYTSDNGFAMGTHRRQPGKTLGFEQDIHVPLIIRGPGVSEGYRDALSSYGMVDLSRTILEITGGFRDYLDDGIKINLHQAEKKDPAHQLARHAIAEYWVLGVEEGVYGGRMRFNNTYRTLRVQDEEDGKSYAFSYSVWCTGERELYDLVSDPHQIDNLLEPLNDVGPFAPFSTLSTSGDGLIDHPILSTQLQKLANRLDALLLVLKRCTGTACHVPYSILFPSASSTGEEIYRLTQALDPKFDDYFAKLPKVKFAKCALGFHEELERPDWTDDWAYGLDQGLTAGGTDRTFPAFRVQGL